MTKIDTSTEAVERLLENVTPGPWVWAAIYCGDVYDLVHWVEGETPPNGDPRYIKIHSDGSAGGEYGPDIDVDGPDARFFTAARDLVPALLKERDEARARVMALEEITEPDFIWGAMDNVHDMDVTLDDYAKAVSRAQRAALATSVAGKFREVRE